MSQSMISVILPTYNEKGNVIPLIGEIHKSLDSYDHEIIVVDDNSPDGTYEEVQNLNLPFVRTILRVENSGLANSIRCGLENASGDIFVVMDSDFNHKPDYLPFMIDSLRYYGCVTASRFLYGGRMDSRSRHVLSWLFNIFVRVSTGGQITDNLYGYFAIKRVTIENINYDRVFWGYGDYYIRLLYFLQRQAVNILQFPAINGRRLSGAGQSNFIGVFWQYFKEVIKLAFKGRIKNV